MKCRDGVLEDTRPLETIAAIVRHYRLRKRPEAERYLRFVRNSRTFSEAMRRSALAEMPGRGRHPHQHRIPQRVLRKFHRRLLQTHLDESGSFDDVYSRINLSASHVKGIGALTVYDTAHRLGAYLGLSPTVVYLHAGTRKGARILGLNHRAKALDLTEIPRGLRSLLPEEIEDCLCIYEKDLRAITSHQRRSFPQSTVAGRSRRSGRNNGDR